MCTLTYRYTKPLLKKGKKEVRAERDNKRCCREARRSRRGADPDDRTAACGHGGAAGHCGRPQAYIAQDAVGSERARQTERMPRLQPRLLRWKWRMRLRRGAAES